MIYKIGKHVVRHGSIMDKEMESLVQGKVDVIYTDPPWGTGNLKFWQTMNTKQTQAERNDIELDAFLDRFFELLVNVSHSRTLIFIEYGIRWDDVIRQYAGRFNLFINAVAKPCYGGGNRPLNLYIISMSTGIALPVGYVRSIENKKGYKTLQTATAPFNLKGKVFYDPCCGMGYTAQLAIDNDGIFYGNELNIKRLQKTMDRLNENIS